jgi:hypothetical protein
VISELTDNSLYWERYSAVIPLLAVYVFEEYRISSALQPLEEIPEYALGAN